MTAGFRTAFGVAIAFAVAGVLAALFLLGRPRKSATVTEIAGRAGREAA